MSRIQGGDNCPKCLGTGVNRKGEICGYHLLAKFIRTQKAQLDQKDEESQKLRDLLGKADFKRCDNELHERDSSYGEDQKERCSDRRDGFKCPSCQWNEGVKEALGLKISHSPTQETRIKKAENILAAMRVRVGGQWVALDTLLESYEKEYGTVKHG